MPNLVDIIDDFIGYIFDTLLFIISCSVSAAGFLVALGPIIFTFLGILDLSFGTNTVDYFMEIIFST